MVDVDLPLMTSLSPEPDSPVPILQSAKYTAKCSVSNKVSVCLSLIFYSKLVSQSVATGIQTIKHFSQAFICISHKR